MEQEYKQLSVIGLNIDLSPISKESKKGMTLGDKASYDLYQGEFQEQRMVFAIPRYKTRATPKVYAITAKNISEVVGAPVVFVLDKCPAYLRQRLISNGVYFIASSKYLFLPNLVANERIRRSEIANRLSVVAQYLLLYHLQVRSLAGLSAKEITPLVPYSNASVALGLICLEDLGLLERITENKRKSIIFKYRGKDLFERALPLSFNPIESTIFCDAMDTQQKFPVCGINALSHYTHLNPDPERYIAVSPASLKQLREASVILGENPFEGDVVIEVWKYQPVTPDGYESDWVDRLSLALSLQNDHDPRVEKEVESLINQTQWKD